MHNMDVLIKLPGIVSGNRLSIIYKIAFVWISTPGSLVYTVLASHVQQHNEHIRHMKFKYTKYKSSKLFWRILEDNKPKKRENRGKKTVNAIRRVGHRHVYTFCWNAVKSAPLSFLPSKPRLFWWLLSVNLCLLVSNSIFCRETKKYSVRSKLNRSKYRSVHGLRTGYKISITGRCKTMTDWV